MPKRQYLRADDRRRTLLGAADRVFARSGLSGLTMVAVADEAGVSRRLLYDHFPDLAALFRAFFDDRAVQYRASIDAAFDAAGGDVIAAVAGVFARLLTIPVADQRALRMLVAGAGPPELDVVRDELRAQTVARWLPVTSTDATAGVAGALVWALSSSILAFAELVGRGELTPELATALVIAMVTDLPERIAHSMSSMAGPSPN